MGIHLFGKNAFASFLPSWATKSLDVPASAFGCVEVMVCIWFVAKWGFPPKHPQNLWLRPRATL